MLIAKQNKFKNPQTHIKGGSWFSGRYIFWEQSGSFHEGAGKKADLSTKSWGNSCFPGNWVSQSILFLFFLPRCFLSVVNRKGSLASRPWCSAPSPQPKGGREGVFVWTSFFVSSCSCPANLLSPGVPALAEKLLPSTSFVASSPADAASWEDYWRDFHGRFQMGKEAAHFREKGPRFTSCSAPEHARWGDMGSWLLSALVYLWELLVCLPIYLEYTSLCFHFLPFQNPSSSTFDFLDSEEEFLTVRKCTFSPSPVLFILFLPPNVRYLVNLR